MEANAPHIPGARSPRERKRLREVFLSDHLALATAGVELAERVAAENAGNPIGKTVASMAVELREELEILRTLAYARGGRRAWLKQGSAWLFEKLGRLTPNGRLLRYSPLSRTVELEALAVLAEQRKLLWTALARQGDGEALVIGADFGARALLAERHRQELEPLFVEAAGAAM